MRTLRERWTAKVLKAESCWLWTGSKTGAGYGNLLGARGVNDYAHRVSYELHIGPIPPGYDVDHLCSVRLCVNPHHLEPVTHAENLRRARRRRAALADTG